MLATPWPKPFADPEWVFELKWDGIRGVLDVGPGADPRLWSRSGKPMLSRYPELATLRPERRLVLDGEIVALDAEGRPSFEVLQRRAGGPGADGSLHPHGRVGTNRRQTHPPAAGPILDTVRNPKNET